jgi:uncharacterized protein (DUF885 family)
MTNPTAHPTLGSSAQPGAPATRLASLCAAVWDSQMAAHPVYATALGDRRFDDRLRDNGPGALAADATRLTGWQEQARAIDPAGLSAADRVTHAALLDFVAIELDLIEAGMDAWSVDPLDGPQVAYLNVPSFQPVRTVAEGEALVARGARRPPRPPDRGLAPHRTGAHRPSRLDRRPAHDPRRGCPGGRRRRDPAGLCPLSRVPR